MNDPLEKTPITYPYVYRTGPPSTEVRPPEPDVQIPRRSLKELLGDVAISFYELMALTSAMKHATRIREEEGMSHKEAKRQIAEKHLAHLEAQPLRHPKDR